MIISFYKIFIKTLLLYIRFIRVKKDVSFTRNRVPLPSPNVAFFGYPLPPPQVRRLLWMVPNSKHVLVLVGQKLDLSKLSTFLHHHHLVSFLVHSKILISITKYVRYWQKIMRPL